MDRGIRRKSKMPNNVVIDARKLGDGGIGVYIENLVDGLIQAKVFDKITLIISPNCNSTALTRWTSKVQLVEDSAKKYSFSEYFLMPLRLKSVFANSLVHFPHYTVPFFLPNTAKVVVTIHDCIHLRNSNILKRIVAKFLLQAAIKRADRIITVSNYSKRDILNNFAVNAERIDVIANSISPELKVTAPQANADYYLFVGNGREHKGLDLLLDSFENEKVLIVGSSFSDQQKQRIASMQSAILVGSCSNAELASLYAGAKALIMPSYEEGFGIPVLEALSFGVPVIATPVASLVEWFGDALWYSNHFDALSLKKALQALLSNPDLRQQKIKQGLELAARFSVENITASTLQSYKKVLPNLKIEISPEKELSKVA